MATVLRDPHSSATDKLTTFGRLSNDPVVGALLGFTLGLVVALSLPFLGLETPPFFSITLAVLGGIVGCLRPVPGTPGEKGSSRPLDETHRIPRSR